MTFPPEDLFESEHAFWFCLKAQPKHEHLAAAALRRSLSIECFCPRIRFRKNTRRGVVWFHEAMFPSYLFARFVFASDYRRVQASPGVSSLVRFGSRVAVIAGEVIEALRQSSGDAETIVIDPQLEIGDRVEITEGAFHGLEAVVTQVHPGKERVKILLEFLGRCIEAEIPVPKVLSTLPARSQAGA